MSDRPPVCHVKIAGDGSAPHPTLHPQADHTVCTLTQSPQSLQPSQLSQPQLHTAVHTVLSAVTCQNDQTSSFPIANEALAAAPPNEPQAARSWMNTIRRVGPVGGAVLVLAAHAVHLLALPLLAAWLGLNAATSPDSGFASSLLSGHAGHAGLGGSGSLTMRWATDLLAAATVAAAISMCGAMARSWRNVRSHPLPCILYTLVALLCVGMVLI